MRQGPTYRSGLAFLGMLVLVLALSPAALAQETEDEETRVVIIENADRLEQVVEDGEAVRRLSGNVRLRQDSTYLESSRALQYLERDEIFFFDDVLIIDEGDSLRADTVFYNRQTKVGEASGNVEFFDGEVRVRAPSGRHHAEEKRTWFTEGVMLDDSLSTLISLEGEYFSEDKRAEFAHEVRLHREWSYLESDSITYHREEEVSLARGDVMIERWEEATEDTPPDSVSRTFLMGDVAYNDEQAGLSRIEGNSFVMQLRLDEDTAEVDTLMMRSDRLEALEQDDQQRITAIGNARSWRQDFAAVADSVVYDRYDYHAGPLEEEPPLLLADAGSPPLVAWYAEGADGDAPDVSSPLESPGELSAPGTIDEIPEDTLAAGDAAAVEEPASVEDTLAVADTVAASDPLVTSGTHAGEDTLDVEVPLVPRDSLGLGQSLAPEDTLEAEGGELEEGELTAAEEEEGWLFPRLGEMLEEYRTESSEEYAVEEDTVEEVRLFRDPVSWFEESQVTADSIRVRTDASPVDSIFARGSVFIAQLDTLSERIHQLRGRNLAGTSVDDSLRTFAVGPNAEAIYHRTNDADEPDGAVQALGDESLFQFIGDDLDYIHFTGGIEGYYYDEEELPPDLQLDGYVWVPERRPAKDALYQEDSLQHERIERLLTTYPPLPERVPEAPPEPEAALEPRTDFEQEEF